MTRVNFEGNGRVLMWMFAIAMGVAAGTAALVLAVVKVVNDAGTPLIGGAKWFLFYLIPVIFFATILTVIAFTILMQQHIKWVY